MSAYYTLPMLDGNFDVYDIVLHTLLSGESQMFAIMKLSRLSSCEIQSKPATKFESEAERPSWLADAKFEGGIKRHSWPTADTELDLFNIMEWNEVCCPLQHH